MPQLLEVALDVEMTLHGQTKRAIDFVPSDIDFGDIETSFLKALSPARLDEDNVVQTIHAIHKVDCQLGKSYVIAVLALAVNILNAQQTSVGKRTLVVTSALTKAGTADVGNKAQEFIEAWRCGVIAQDTFSDEQKNVLCYLAPTFWSCDGKKASWAWAGIYEDTCFDPGHWKSHAVLVCPGSYSPALEKLERHIRLRIEEAQGSLEHFKAAHPVLVVDESDLMHKKPYDFSIEDEQNNKRLYHIANIFYLCSIHVGLTGVCHPFVSPFAPVRACSRLFACV